MATLEDLRNVLFDRTPHELAIEISGFTGFRTTLIEELTQEEIDILYKIHKRRYDESIEEKRKWSSYILKIATDEGIHRPVMVVKYGKNVVDCWYSFNHWMLTQSTAKKLLYHCNVEEMEAVHQQLCKLRDNNEKSAQKPMNKAWWRKGVKNRNLN